MTEARVARNDTAVEIAWLGGSVHRILLDGSATANRLAAFRSSMAGGAASPVHVHDREDETVLVLSGAATAWAGDDRWELGPGDIAFLPRGVPHTYTITSDTAELMTFCNPAGMEHFFTRAGWDMSKPMPEGWQVDMAVLSAAGEANGQHVLGPPLAPGEAMPHAHRRA